MSELDKTRQNNRSSKTRASNFGYTESASQVTRDFAQAIAPRTNLSPGIEGLRNSMNEWYKLGVQIQSNENAERLADIQQRNYEADKEEVVRANAVLEKVEPAAIKKALATGDWRGVKMDGQPVHFTRKKGLEVLEVGLGRVQAADAEQEFYDRIAQGMSAEDAQEAVLDENTRGASDLYTVGFADAFRKMTDQAVAKDKQVDAYEVGRRAQNNYLANLRVQISNNEINGPEALAQALNGAQSIGASVRDPKQALIFEDEAREVLFEEAAKNPTLYRALHYKNAITRLSFVDIHKEQYDEVRAAAARASQAQWNADYSKEKDELREMQVAFENPLIQSVERPTIEQLVDKMDQVVGMYGVDPEMKTLIKDISKLVGEDVSYNSFKSHAQLGIYKRTDPDTARAMSQRIYHDEEIPVQAKGKFFQASPSSPEAKYDISQDVLSSDPNVAGDAAKKWLIWSDQMGADPRDHMSDTAYDRLNILMYNLRRKQPLGPVIEQLNSGEGQHIKDTTTAYNTITGNKASDAWNEDKGGIVDAMAARGLDVRDNNALDFGLFGLDTLDADEVVDTLRMQYAQHLNIITRLNPNLSDEEIRGIAIERMAGEVDIANVNGQARIVPRVSMPSVNNDGDQVTWGGPISVQHLREVDEYLKGHKTTLDIEVDGEKMVDSTFGQLNIVGATTTPSSKRTGGLNVLIDSGSGPEPATIANDLQTGGFPTTQRARETMFKGMEQVGTDERGHPILRAEPGKDYFIDERSGWVWNDTRDVHELVVLPPGMSEPSVQEQEEQLRAERVRLMGTVEPERTIPRPPKGPYSPFIDLARQVGQEWKKFITSRTKRGRLTTARKRELSSEAPQDLKEFATKMVETHEQEKEDTLHLLNLTAPEHAAFYSQVYDFIAKEEGERLWVYDDYTGRRLEPGDKALGKRTISIGINLEAEGAREKFEALGLNYDKILKGELDLTRGQSKQLMATQLKQAAQALHDTFPPEQRRHISDHMWVALMSLYHHGPGTIGPNLRQAIANQDWDAAYTEITERTLGGIPPHLRDAVRQRRFREGMMFRGSN